MHSPCTVKKDTLCLPVDEPQEDEYVSSIATPTRNTRIQPLTTCSTQEKWHDLSVPSIRGNSTHLGRDNACREYNECDLSSYYVTVEKTPTSDYKCKALTDREQVSRRMELPAFAVVKETRTTACVACRRIVVR